MNRTRISPDRAAALARRPDVAQLYIRGETQAAIAQRFAVNQSQISRDLKVIQKEWVKAGNVNIDRAKAAALSKLDEVERQAWLGWERSLKDAEKQKISTGSEEEAKGKKKPKGARIEKVTEGQSGNPRFLEVVIRSIERRCLILGIDAPKRTELTGSDGEPVPITMIETILPATPALVPAAVPPSEPNDNPKPIEPTETEAAAGND